jgi:hypothetical protein
MSRIEVFSLHSQDALVPLRGDLHVRDVRYEIIKGTDFDGHNVPPDEQGVRDKDLSLKFIQSRLIVPSCEVFLNRYNKIT